MSFTRRPQARGRLFCFPHAGGSAAVYRPWSTALPDDWEVVAVQLPGRGQLLRRPMVTSMTELVDGLLPTLLPQLDRPFAFFGHSMGAVLAAELARAVRAESGKCPEHLAVSGRRPPRVPGDEAPLHPLPDEQFVAEVNRRYGGIPPELLRDREVLDLLLPSLRADITALETYPAAASPRLPCSITAYGGTEDPVTPLPHLEAWRAETTGPVRVRRFPGGHFYLTARMAELLADLAGDLATLDSPVAVEDGRA